MVFFPCLFQPEMVRSPWKVPAPAANQPPELYHNGAGKSIEKNRKIFFASRLHPRYNQPMTTTNTETAPAAKPANPYRISSKQYFRDNGMDTAEERYAALEDFVSEGIVPALCTEGCEVEPDGRCPHGCPSILLALGMI
jgi:hypothetical protein